MTIAQSATDLVNAITDYGTAVKTKVAAKMPLQNMVIGFQAEYDAGLSGGAKTLLLTDGSKQHLTLNAVAALTIDTTDAPVGQYQVRLIQDAIGGYTPTFSNLDAGRWIGSASAPSINTAANAEALLVIYWDGTHMTQSLSNIGAA